MYRSLRQTYRWNSSTHYMIGHDRTYVFDIRNWRHRFHTTEETERTDVGAVVAALMMTVTYNRRTNLVQINWAPWGNYPRVGTSGLLRSAPIRALNHRFRHERSRAFFMSTTPLQVCPHTLRSSCRRFCTHRRLSGGLELDKLTLTARRFATTAPSTTAFTIYYYRRTHVIFHSRSNHGVVNPSACVYTVQSTRMLVVYKPPHIFLWTTVLTVIECY